MVCIAVWVPVCCTADSESASYRLPQVVIPTATGDVVCSPQNLVLCIYHDPGWRLPPDDVDEHTIVALWRDGRVIWSGDSMEGGPPFRTAHVSRARVAQFVGSASACAHIDDVTGIHFGPDSAYHAVYFAVPGRTVYAESWHELFERNEKVVVTSHGVSGLGGRTRAEVHAADVPEYQSFRLGWGDIRSLAASLVAEASPVSRAVEVKERFIWTND